MKFTANDFLRVFIYILIFQVIALISWYCFDYNIFVPMIAGSIGSYIASRSSKKKIQKQ